MTVRKTAPAPAASSASETSNAKATGGQTYRIIKDDSLSKIALEAYGNASMWPAIKAFNEKKVGKNELILTGDTLRLPTAAEAKEIMAQLHQGQKAAGKPETWGKQSGKPPAGFTPQGAGAPAAARAGAAEAPAAAAAGPADSMKPAAAGAAAAAAEPVAGIGVDNPDVSTGLYKPPAGTTPRKLVSEAFGIRPEEVSPLHVASLSQTNPKLKFDKLDEAIGPGAVVQMIGTPQLARMQVADNVLQRKNIQNLLAEDAAAPEGTEGKLTPEGRADATEDLKKLTEQAPQLQAANKRSEFVGQIGAMQSRITEEPSAENIKKAYAPFIAQAAKEMPELLPLVKVSQRASYEQAGKNAAAKSDAAGYRANLVAVKELLTEEINAEKAPLKKADLIRARAQNTLTQMAIASDEPKLTAYLKGTPHNVTKDKPLPAEITAATKEVEAKITALTAEANGDLKAVVEIARSAAAAATDPAIKANLTKAAEANEALVKDAQASSYLGIAQMHQSLKNPAGMTAAWQQALNFRLGLDPKTPTLTPSVTETIGSDEKKAWYFGTDVQRLSPAQLKTVTDKLATLSKEDREAALATIDRYSAESAATQTHSGVSVSSQIMHEVAKTDPAWAQKATLLEAGVAMNVGAIKHAESMYEALRKHANGPDAAAIQQLALMGQTSALVRLSQEGDASLRNGPTEKEASAQKLTALRSELEASLKAFKPGAKGTAPAEAGAIADVNASEIEALLASGQSEKAEEALAHLKATYGELPQIKAAVSKMEKEYRQNGAVAFLKALGAEGMNTSGTDMAIAAGVGAGVGAAATIAFWAGMGTLIPIPGVGTLSGAALGGVLYGLGALGAVTVGKSLAGGHAWQAGRTGLSSVGTAEALLGAAASAGNFVGLGAGGAMLTKVGGKLGLEAAAKGVKGGADVVRVLESRVSQLESASPGIFNGLSDAQKLAEAQKSLQHEFLNAGLVFGTKTQGAAMGVQVLGMGKQWYEVAHSDSPEEEKNRQTAQIHQQIATVVAQGAIMGGALGGLTRGIYRGTPAEIRTALKSRVTDPHTYNRSVKMGEEIVFDVNGAIKGTKTGDATLATVGTAPTGIKITGQKVGNTTVVAKKSLWSKEPNIKVNVTVTPTEVDTLDAKGLLDATRFFIETAKTTARTTRTATDGHYEKALTDAIDARIKDAADRPIPGTLTKREWKALRKELAKAIKLNTE